MSRKIALLAVLLGVMIVMTGCFNIDQPILAENGGIWDSYFVYPLSWLMTTLAETFGNSYGIAIILVTILIRLLILPLMIKQTKSTKAMQAIQPEMEKLREKYSAKDQQTQQKLQQEMMQLFQQHGVNPLAGCLPIFVQMPILIGLYHAIIRTPEINPDISEKYSHYQPEQFLWFELGSADPYFLLPIIAAATTFIQQKMMMVNVNNPQMKVLLYLMPIMILVFAMFFPAALALYWVIGNLFMITQTYFITGPNVGKDKNDANTGGASKK
ncbi:YidC family membrane integrase SpoIIIJ [Texcoconibacillus texcoconensis]|uniref:Membrane protein insertase YidC n=1 Tax=Texcoconibacillus texcoconensis TaxID=1095777 RepID=A0A840QTV6_9BACI|nr:YidC/Oxa1 family membrane protein insertase [Texcoconibacillus texcoconensis]